MNRPSPPEDPADPLAAAIAAFRAMPVPPRPPDGPWVARMAAGTPPAAAPSIASRRKTLMRIASLSAASTLAVAVVATWLAAPRSIALGDVLEAAGRHKLVRYRMVQEITMRADGQVLPLEEVAYADLRAPRYRTEHRALSLGGAIDFESVFVREGVRGVRMHRITEQVTEKGRTDPEMIATLKGFERLGVPRKSVILTALSAGPTPDSADESRSILENLRDLEGHKAAVATRAKLGGVDTLKYRVEEGRRTTVLWVAPATRLPVRLEYESTDPRDLHPTTTLTRYVLDAFEWDPEPQGQAGLDDLFSVAPPPGYKVEDRREQARPAAR